MRLTDLSFDAWLEHTFGRAVRSDCFPFFDDREEFWDPQPTTGVEYLTRLFENPASALRNFGDRQIGSSLWMLASEDAHCIYSRDVPVAARERCIAAIATLFADLFDPRCAPVLGHLDQPGSGPLNMACYMWWENFPPVALAEDPASVVLDARRLKVLETTLTLANPACRESALHGLGHDARCRPERIRAIIDE